MPTRSRVPHVVTEVGTEGSLEVTFAASMYPASIDPAAHWLT